LQELKQELESATGVHVETISADLSILSEVDNAFSKAVESRQIHAAILNAGITHFGEHTNLNWTQFERVLNTNVTSVAKLLSNFIAHFEEHNLKGSIMLVSSIAGIIPLPYQTAYSGTKAFLFNFGQALSQELKHKGISITVFAPGGIGTEMTQTAAFRPLHRWTMPVDKVARLGLLALRRRNTVYIPGTLNRIGVILSKLLPQKFVVRQIGSTYRRALEKSGYISPVK
jgi:short-subunit dehydrogenase